MINLDLVTEATKKCFIHQLFRLNVGGEDHQLIEWNLKLYAVL
jgi:hypothetical protein